MWKTFLYSGRQRIAYIAPKGPAYQVMDCGEWVCGFRHFIKDKMKDVACADNLFKKIPGDVVALYPELENAK